MNQDWKVIKLVVKLENYLIIEYRLNHLRPPGNNNKINWPIDNKQEMIDIIETVYRGARKGRGLVISPKDYSTKYKY